MNLAQLVVSLTSDTSSFITGMKNAERSVSTLEATVKRAQRQGFDPMIARMGQAAQGAKAWDDGMRRITGGAEAMNTKLDNSAKAFRSLRSPIVGIVSALTGIPGPLGNVASLLGMFAVGAGPVLAWVAGIGALTAAWLHFTKGAREAAKAADETWEQLTKGPQRAQLAESQSLLKEFLAMRGTLLRQLESGQKVVLGAGGTGRFEPMSEQDKTDLRKRITERLDTEIAQISTRIKSLQLEIDPPTWDKPEVEKRGRQIGNEMTNAIVLSFEEHMRRRNRLGSEWMEGLAQRARDASRVFQEMAEPVVNMDDATKGLPDWLVRAVSHAELWERAWKNAVEGVQRSVVDFFANMFQEGQTFLDMIHQMLRSLARIAANLLSQQIIGAIGPAIGLGGSVTHANGATGPSLRAGDTYQTVNVYNISAIDAKSFHDTLQANRHSVAAATGRAMSESRSLSRMNRGW